MVTLAPLSASPRFALCIATVGRIKELDRLLTSLEQQTYVHFHIYLADQNAPGVLDAMLARHAALPLTRIMLPSRGLSAARNRLLPEAADEDILAFPDDDCWYAPDTLEQAVAALHRHPDAGSVLASWTPDAATPPRDVRERPLSAHALFAQGNSIVQFHRAEAMRDLRFDPQLGVGTGLPYGSGEDTDFLLQAQRRAPIWRCPAIRVFHPSPATQVPSAEKIAAYATGRMFLLRKHGFPFWFRCVNVLYPLLMLPLAAMRLDRAGIWYRWRMFAERLRHF